MNLIRLFGLFLGFFAATSLATAEGATPASYKVASVQGAAFWANPPGGEAQALSLGQVLPEGAVITTEANAQVTLAFSTGAVAVIGENSELAVSKFSQAVFDPVAPQATSDEAEASAIELTLNRGTVTSKVNKLRKGSTYEVTTPIGAAGVRGTSYSVTYDPVAKVLEVRTAEGDVVFVMNTTQVETSVPGGKKITLRFETGPDGEVIPGSVVLGDLTPGEVAAILRLLGNAIGEGFGPAILRQLQTQTILSDDTL